MKFRTTAKQIAAGIIAAAMLIGTLAGCSGNSTKQSSASSKAETSTASVKRGESHDPPSSKPTENTIFSARIALGSKATI